LEIVLGLGSAGKCDSAKAREWDAPAPSPIGQRTRASLLPPPPTPHPFTSPHPPRSPPLTLRLPPPPLPPSSFCFLVLLPFFRFTLYRSFPLYRWRHCFSLYWVVDRRFSRVSTLLSFIAPRSRTVSFRSQISIPLRIPPDARTVRKFRLPHLLSARRACFPARRMVVAL